MAAWIGIVALLVLMGVVFANAPPPQTWSWDLLNGIGFAGFVLLLWCSQTAPASPAKFSHSALRYHYGLAGIAVVAGLTHAIGLLITNPASVEYLKWRAPAHMHAGNVAMLLLLLLSVIGVAPLRRRLHQNLRSFRILHRGMTFAAIVLMLWHVAGSGYLVREPMQIALFGLATLVACWVWWRYPGRWRLPRFKRRDPTVRPLALVLLAVPVLAMLLAWYMRR